MVESSFIRRNVHTFCTTRWCSCYSRWWGGDGDDGAQLGAACLRADDIIIIMFVWWVVINISTCLSTPLYYLEPQKTKQTINPLIVCATKLNSHSKQPASRSVNNNRTLWARFINHRSQQTKQDLLPLFWIGMTPNPSINLKGNLKFEQSQLFIQYIAAALTHKPTPKD